MSKDSRKDAEFCGESVGLVYDFLRQALRNQSEDGALIDGKLGNLFSFATAVWGVSVALGSVLLSGADLSLLLSMVGALVFLPTAVYLGVVLVFFSSYKARTYMDLDNPQELRETQVGQLSEEAFYRTMLRNIESKHKANEDVLKGKRYDLSTLLKWTCLQVAATVLWLSVVAATAALAG